MENWKQALLVLRKYHKSEQAKQNRRVKKEWKHGKYNHDTLMIDGYLFGINTSIKKVRRCCLKIEQRDRIRKQKLELKNTAGRNQLGLNLGK